VPASPQSEFHRRRRADAGTWHRSYDSHFQRGERHPHPTSALFTPGETCRSRLDLPGINQFNWPLSPAEYATFREQGRTFEDIGLYYTGFGGNLYSAKVTGLGRPEHVPALGVTDGVLPILEVGPLLGRRFTRADDEQGSPDTVMITYGYWRSKFGGDRSVIGKTIDIDGKPSTIIGVLPRRFRFLDMTDLGVLLPLRPQSLRGYNYFAVARLKPGVTAFSRAQFAARSEPRQRECIIDLSIGRC
jgi:hypothetical protein